MKENQTIILLSDIIESKVRKEKELAYYQEQLRDISVKISQLNNDLSLTQLIIDMINNDGIKDIKEYMIEKKS
tara:strand:+ start:47 stop:265 length:219 start_codon:yes stop_codon:yes gene_type:complete